MRIALIILAAIGVALLLWGCVGLFVSYTGWDDPPPPAGFLDALFWSAIRELFLGISTLGVAAFFWKREQAKDDVRRMR